jgi:hypothetical protein
MGSTAVRFADATGSIESLASTNRGQLGRLPQKLGLPLRRQCVGLAPISKAVWARVTEGTS